MTEKTPIINILTYKLPYDISNQIYNEYQSRIREALYLIKNYKTYKILEKDIKTVELLLALSIFYKRIIANFDAAVKFYGTISKMSNADTIKIGSYNLTGEEKNKLLAIVLNYKKIINKYSIQPFMMEYYETREFLKNLITLKSLMKYE